MCIIYQDSLRSFTITMKIGLVAVEKYFALFAARSAFLILSNGNEWVFFLKIIFVNFPVSKHTILNQQIVFILNPIKKIRKY